MLEVLDFLDRLAPFNKPELMLRDEKPFITAAVTRDYVPPSRPRDKKAGHDKGPSSLDLLRQSLGRH